jgi:hypothetical protein
LEGLSTEIVGIHMYFQPIGNILWHFGIFLWPFGIFCGHCIYVFCTVLVFCSWKNLATLVCADWLCRTSKALLWMLYFGWTSLDSLISGLI